MGDNETKYRPWICFIPGPSRRTFGGFTLAVLLLMLLVYCLHTLDYGVKPEIMTRWRKENHTYSKFWRHINTKTSNKSKVLSNGKRKGSSSIIKLRHRDKNLVELSPKSKKSGSEKKVDCESCLDEKYERNFLQKDNKEKQAGPSLNDSKTLLNHDKLYEKSQKVDDFMTATFLELLKKSPPPYLQRYKNPCWFEIRHKKPPRLRCLPYFYIAGFPKCGTTELFVRVMRHPQIAPPSRKEPHWWTRKRYQQSEKSKQLPTMRDYLSYFIDASQAIQHSCMEPHCFHQMITGEASASTFWDNDKWTSLAGNEGQEEPVVLTASHIHHVTPKARFVLMLRNPVDRLYSDYLYFNGGNTNGQDFHQRVVGGIIDLMTCMKTRSVRSCAYDKVQDGLVKGKNVRLTIGLYSVYFYDWLKIFPREQFLPVMLEEYSQNKTRELMKIFSFLGLESQNASFYTKILATDNRNTQKDVYQTKGPMLNSTRTLLQQFYAPFNEQLSQLFNDRKYLTKWGGYDTH